jgi:hypothetical protein
VEAVLAECLDWQLILGARHLDRVLLACVKHHDQKHPHRGLRLLAPESDGDSDMHFLM